ncbi:hypothetical protein H0H92_008678 [Tricholoma furcatifolium]|nr:hypothetical protein H0H92_008678 [Tricholoma furcatifolium]
MALQELFPPPRPARTELAPRTWAGITPKSTETTRRLIQESHEKLHVFFLREYRAHNHSVHTALAQWALGADHEIIQAMYDHDAPFLLPRFNSPEKITDDNFNKHLGDDDAYLEYFKEVVTKRGTTDVVEDYLFSQKNNFASGNEVNEQPEMLNRCMDGIIHSLIQVGYGLEFNIPGLVAEGLAWTSVHFKSSSAVMPASIWEVANSASEPGASLVSRLQAVTFGTRPTTKPAQDNTHALTILGRILKDTRFDGVRAEENYAVLYSNITSQSELVNAINEYVRSWSYDQSKPHEVERKIEELVYANTMIYAVAGWSKGEPFNDDFFHVHLVTSALFLYSICDILKPSSQEILLRSYFAVCLTWWIGRGRPGFDVENFFAETSVNPGPATISPTLHKDALPTADSPKSGNPNPWLRIMQEGLALPEEHLPKALRALAHFSEMYGGRTAGQEDFATIELPGADLIDGTLFVRAAILTNSKLKEKDVDLSMAKYWDRKGFYKS